MKTAYDVISLAIFAGLIVLFLQRSTSDGSQEDASLLQYLVAGVGCGAANYFGNQGENAIAVALIAATLGYILYYLKPFGFGRR